MVDADKDGALSKPEMANALQMMRKMRAVGPAAGRAEGRRRPCEAMKQQATGGN